ncbi:MAG: chemotaxis protein CheW [Alteromonadaceae bacterium]|nr:MAG: chemotaxis protein CheW [Alteromonadaceae bacterium]
MTDNAFKALSNLAALSRSSAKGLPSQRDVAPRWSGVGFSCMGYRFVIPMGQVTELMEVPPSTRLPSVQRWVIGLSNVRGRLLPLFDLAKFVGGQIGNQKKTQRVLVLENDNLYSGLVVDRAYGMQHFVSDTYDKYSEELPDGLAKYTTGSYRDASAEIWGVFDLDLLANDDEFLNAAII